MVTEIRLFGVLKKFGSSGCLILDVPDSCTAKDVKDAVTRYLSIEYPDAFRGELVDRAALANGSKVLANEDTILKGDRLALLPPVCGG